MAAMRLRLGPPELSVPGRSCTTAAVAARNLEFGTQPMITSGRDYFSLKVSRRLCPSRTLSTVVSKTRETTVLRESSRTLTACLTFQK